jgi:hypothetical protein
MAQLRWNVLAAAVGAAVVSMLACSGSGDPIEGDRRGGTAASGSASGTGGSGKAGDKDGAVDFGTGPVTPRKLIRRTDGGLGDASGGGLPPDEEGNCGGVEVVPEVKMTVVPGNILLIFDKSGSMCQTWGAGTGPKWLDAYKAIAAAAGPLKDNVTIGAIFFPDVPSSGSCGVPAFGVAPQIGFLDGATFLATWADYWTAANGSASACMTGSHPVQGATPLLPALKVADAALASGALTGTTSVVIITDGQPNCSGGNSNVDEPVGNLTPTIAAWLMAGYKTYVVGLPGVASAVPLLDGLAIAGGTMKHIPANDPVTLQTELAKIIGSSVSTNFDSCTLPIDKPPPNLDDVSLVVVENGKRLSVARDLGKSGGWTITADGTSIVLQGIFCDNAKAGQYDKISAVFGCVELPPLPPPDPPVPE